MYIQARKIHFIQEFLRVADDDLVTKFEKLLRVERKKQLDKELRPMTMNEFDELIDKSENDFNNGRVTESQNLLDQIESWK